MLYEVITSYPSAILSIPASDSRIPHSAFRLLGSFSPKLLYDAVNLLGRQVPVGFSVYQHGRRPITIADTTDRQKREQPVRACFSGLNAQLLTEILLDGVVAIHPTDQARITSYNVCYTKLLRNE